MGAVGYPARLFAAVACWGWYAALVGYVGGQAFEEDPAPGLAVGVVVLVESARFVWSRRPGGGSGRGAAPPADPPAGEVAVMPGERCAGAGER
jgi:membrane-associated protein